MAIARFRLCMYTIEMNYVRVIDEIFRQFKGQKFSIKLWDGKERYYGSGKITAFTLLIKNEATVQRLLAQGSLGFGEAYMDGSLQIRGDLEAYLRLRHQFKQVRRSWRLALATFLAGRKIPHDRKGQIIQHYDLGNEFFRMILDHKTMSYSAGRYENVSETLEQAQLKKLNFICEWLDLPANASILDLGSGWGGFAKFAAQTFKWHVTGYTLSNAQLNYCKKVASIKTVKNLIVFKDRDMTNLPTTQFDGIVIIEAIEHVGKEKLTNFLYDVAKALKPGTPLIIQTTGRYQPHRVDRWTLKYVFPGGYLPAKSELFDAASDAGLIIEEFRDDTQDYIFTMTEWIKNLESHKSDIERMFDKSFYRLWELWMHGAKVNFEIGSMSLFRIRLRKPE